jgi:biotin carboxyl carrier protein
MINVVRIGEGVYRVEMDGRAHVVYVAGPPANRWAFWNGRVFRASQSMRSLPPFAAKREAHQELTAPMPATVLKVLVAVGAHVKKGETLVILEAENGIAAACIGRRDGDGRRLPGG